MNLAPKRKISVQFKKLVTVSTLVIILITLSLFFYFKVRQSEVPRTTITTNKPGQNVTLTNTPTIYNPNKLVVTRQDDPVDHLSALKITITDAILVKKLYDDILVLPTLFPAEKCPMGGHIIYSLTFYQDNKLIATAVYSNLGGCRTVSLNREAVLVAQQPFLSDFQKATGLSRKAIFGF